MKQKAISAGTELSDNLIYLSGDLEQHLFEMSNRISSLKQLLGKEVVPEELFANIDAICRSATQLQALVDEVDDNITILCQVIDPLFRKD